MAQRTIVELTDDLDGGKADESIAFGLDGTSYEIDLSEQNARKLRDDLSQYVGAARRARAGRSGRGARGSGGASSRSKGDTAAIGEWAQAHGHKVSARGRIPASVQDAYAAAQS